MLFTFEFFQETLFDTKFGDERDLCDLVDMVGEHQVCQWICALFLNWTNTATGFKRKQENKILWRIGCYPLFVGRWLDDGSKLSWDDKAGLVSASEALLLSVPHSYGPEEPMENAYFMWWDLLGGERKREIDPFVLESLRRLSQHPDGRVQYAALHGLGHFKDEGRIAVIDNFIQRHPEWRDDRWIQQCRDGTVM